MGHSRPTTSSDTNIQEIAQFGYPAMQFDFKLPRYGHVGNRDFAADNFRDADFVGSSLNVGPALLR
jgi:hypothetical protein